MTLNSMILPSNSKNDQEDENNVSFSENFQQGFGSDLVHDFRTRNKKDLDVYTTDPDTATSDKETIGYDTSGDGDMGDNLNVVSGKEVPRSVITKKGSNFQFALY